MPLPYGIERSSLKTRLPRDWEPSIVRSRCDDSQCNRLVYPRIVFGRHSHGRFDNSAMRVVRAKGIGLTRASVPCRKSSTIALSGSEGSLRQARSCAHWCGTTGNPMIFSGISILRDTTRIAVPRVDLLTQILSPHV